MDAVKCVVNCSCTGAPSQNWVRSWHGWVKSIRRRNELRWRDCRMWTLKLPAMQTSTQALV